MPNPQLQKGGPAVLVPIAVMAVPTGTTAPSTAHFSVWEGSTQVVPDTLIPSVGSSVTVNGITFTNNAAGGPSTGITLQASSVSSVPGFTGAQLLYCGAPGSTSSGPVDISFLRRNPLVVVGGQAQELTESLNVPGSLYVGGSLVAPFVNAVKVTVNYSLFPNLDTFIILDTTSGTLTATLPDPTSYNGPSIGIGCTGTGGASGTVATAGTSKTITGSTTVAQGSTRLYTRLSDGSGWWQH